MSSLGRFLGGTLLFGTLGLVACAQGTTDVDPNAGKQTKQTKEPTEPEEPSVKVPTPGTSSGDDPEPEPDPDPGASSSGGSSSGGASSGGTSTSSSGGTSTSSSGGSTSSSGGSSSGATSSSGGSTSSSGGIGACVTTAPSNACGLDPQCGCAANETCNIANKSTGAVSCSLAGGGPLASLCTTSSQCAKGFTCAYGACRPYCSTLNTACTTSGTGMCTELWENGAAVPNGKVCTISCDLRNPSTVCGSNNCIYDASVKAADCDKAGTKALYDACSTYNECGQGLACVNHPFYGPECEKWCRVGMDSDCSVFEVCEDVYGVNAPSQGGYTLGHCQ
jgi:hypothetical protein